MHLQFPLIGVHIFLVLYMCFRHVDLHCTIIIIPSQCQYSLHHPVYHHFLYVTCIQCRKQEEWETLFHPKNRSLAAFMHVSPFLYIGYM